MELGKLAPDLMTDELVAKRAKQEKMKAFASNINKANIKNMKVVPKAVKMKEEEEKRVKEQGISKRQQAIEYAQNVKKPVVKRAKPPAPVAKTRRQRDRENEEMASSSKYTDFEGSMYDDEDLGFDGAEGLVGGRGRGSPQRGGGEGITETSVDQVKLAELDAENESARLQVERLKAEFGL